MNPLELVVVGTFATFIVAAVLGFAKSILGVVFKMLPHVGRLLVTMASLTPVALRFIRSAIESRHTKHFVRSMRKQSIVVAGNTQAFLHAKRVTEQPEEPVAEDPAWAEYETPAYIRKGRVLSF